MHLQVCAKGALNAPLEDLSQDPLFTSLVSCAMQLNTPPTLTAITLHTSTLIHHQEVMNTMREQRGCIRQTEEDQICC